MRVQGQSAILTHVLQKVLSITEKKTNMPILSNVLIKAVGPETGTIEFSVTDLELSLWTQMEAKVEAGGSTTVPARKLLEVVRELPLKEIVLEELPNNKLLVQSGRSRFELPTISAEDFPYLTFYEDLPLASCDPVALRQSFDKTVYGVPSEEDPFNIPGLYCHAVGKGHLRLVSTDGHRLTYFEVPEDSYPGMMTEKGVVIPRKGVQEIIRVLEKETEASLGIHENCLLLKTPSTLLSTRLLEAEFPEYQVIIPEERPSSLVVDWESFFRAIKRVAVLADQKFRHVRFRITKGSLELEAGNPDLGFGNDVLDIEYEGEDFAIAFNTRYILDTLQAMETSKVKFEWVDLFHGGIFLGIDDPNYFSLIMPMVV